VGTPWDLHLFIATICINWNHFSFYDFSISQFFEDMHRVSRQLPIAPFVAIAATTVHYKLGNNVSFSDAPANVKEAFMPKVVTLRSGSGLFHLPGGTKYDGDVKDGLWHGRGKLYNTRKGELYDGEWGNGKRSGQGLRVWPSGERYDGAWKNDLWHGEGRLNSPNGDVYNGQWVECRREGWGTLCLANGDLYEGRFASDLYDGFGTLSTVSDKYVGEWEGGLRHGLGCLTSAEGTFEGQFVRDRKHGRGVLTLSGAAAIYEGTWANGELTGVGVYHTEAGESYAGGFVNGRKCGQGELMLNTAGAPKDRSRYVGNFVNDKFHGEGTLTQGSGDELGDVYKGEWRLGKRHGAGVLTLAGGDIYDGEFEDDLWHGNGIFVSTRGGVYSQQYNKGHLVRSVKI